MIVKRNTVHMVCYLSPVPFGVVASFAIPFKGMNTSMTLQSKEIPLENSIVLKVFGKEPPSLKTFQMDHLVGCIQVQD